MRKGLMDLDKKRTLKSLTPTDNFILPNNIHEDFVPPECCRHSSKSLHGLAANFSTTSSAREFNFDNKNGIQ